MGCGKSFGLYTQRNGSQECLFLGLKDVCINDLNSSDYQVKMGVKRKSHSIKWL